MAFLPAFQPFEQNEERVKDKPLRWKVHFPNRLFSAHPGPLTVTVPPGKPRSVARLSSGSAIGIQPQDGGREGCSRQEAGEDIVPGREMLQGRSGGTGRTHLPVRRQLPRQRSLAALPGCEADLVGWLVSLGLIGSWCCARTAGLAGLGDGGDQSLHLIWWFSLAEMLSLPPPSRAGSSPARPGLDPCHGAPSPAAGPCRQ